MLNKLDELPIELKIEIASHLETLYSLGCCSRDWYNITNSPNTKYRWLLNKYGCIHALFHAVRIGYPLFNSEVAETLLKYSHISRYFIQRLKFGYGKHGYWGNNISDDVYETIINFEERYRNDDRNDILLIRQVLEGIGNEDSIITIIESYGFIPFPPNPISTTYIFERPAAAEYEDALPKNGYTSVSELMIVARAIITYPNLLNVWKKMGYHKITDDLENSVVQLALLDLYSTEVPPVRTVAETLSNLQSIGFPLTDIVIGNVILLFKWRLADVGDSLIEGFSTARELSKTDIREMCLIQMLNPARTLEQYDALNYIINSVNNPEQQILSAFEKYKIVEDGNDPSRSHAFLKYSPIVYRYMLRFGAQSPVVQYLMKEILMIHAQLTDTEDVDKLREADAILDEYYTANVLFERSLFPLFKKCSRTKPTSYLFEGYLAKLFGHEVRHQSSLAFQIPEVDVLTSPTQIEKLRQLWLEDIRNCIDSEEFVNDEFRKQITEFFARCTLSQSSFDYSLHQLY